MCKAWLAATIIAVVLAVLPAAAHEPNPYRQSLKAKSFSTQVYAPDVTDTELATAMRVPRKTVIEVQVVIENFLPRALAPVLIIDGQQASRRSRIVETKNSLTTIGFLVEQPSLLREGASLAVQMGDQNETRSTRTEPFSFERVKRMDEAALGASGLRAPQ